MADLLYNQTKAKFGDGTLDWDVSSIWVALLKTGHSYTPNKDDLYLSTPIPTAYSGNEYANSLGYVRKQIAGAAVSIDTAGDKAIYHADDITWTAISCGAIVAAILFARIGADFTTPADDILLAFYDFSVTPNGGDITLRWNTGTSPSACFTIT